MTITFRPVTENNFHECTKLAVREDQPFVASNVYSIAQSKVEPFWITAAIYADETMVGFVMYVVDADEGELYLCRFMVDKDHQHKGYGKAALDLLKDIAVKTPGIKRMKLSTEPHNANGIRIYEKFGFKDTGVLDDDEEVFVLKLEK